MLEMGSVNRGNGLHAQVLLAPAILVMLFAPDAFAGDQAPSAKSAQPPIAASLFAPPLISSLQFSVPQTPSATEFRPRRRGLPAADSPIATASVFDAPMLQDTSIARQMAESKSLDRVRLLTLWQSRASSVSLQAGRHGAPSLQWSTPWMHREATSRGLFDRLITVSPHMFGSPGRNSLPRQPAGMTSTKAAEAGLGGKPQ